MHRHIKQIMTSAEPALDKDSHDASKFRRTSHAIKQVAFLCPAGLTQALTHIDL